MNNGVEPFLEYVSNHVKKNDTKRKSTKYKPNVYENTLIEINQNNETVQPKVEQTVNKHRLIDYRKFFFAIRNL